MTETGDVRSVVREKYGAIAEGKPSGSGCCGRLRLRLRRRRAAPRSATPPSRRPRCPRAPNLGLGCGNPLGLAAVRSRARPCSTSAAAPASTASSPRARSGPTGRVIGVDMTPDMIERARANAAQGRVSRNVEFRLGEIEHLPVADAQRRRRDLELRHQPLARQAAGLPRGAARAQARRPDAGQRPRAHPPADARAAAVTSTSTSAASPARRCATSISR